MKSIKIIAAVATGLLALGALSASAAASLNINITTSQQVATTVGSVTTFTSTPMTIKNADILAKVASTMGITLPVGARLAVSTTSDTLDGINVGDVVILSAQGVILWDLNNRDGYDNETDAHLYHISIRVNFFNNVSETKTASKSVSVTSRGYGRLYIDIHKYAGLETPASGWTIDNYDNLGLAQYTYGNPYTNGKFGSPLASGSVSFGGAAEYYSYATGNYSPANQTVAGAAANVPWSLLRNLFNND